MKPHEVVIRSFYLFPTTDQAAKHECTAILKASDSSEADRAECQFTTTATVLDNGSQIASDYIPKEIGIQGFFQAIGSLWKLVVDFFTGRTCRNECTGFFQFSCHLQYICLSWLLLFGLFLALFPAAVVLLWLLHQRGFFDPLYDWWDDRFGSGDGSRIYSNYGDEYGHPDDYIVQGVGHHLHRGEWRRRPHAHKMLKAGHSHHVLHRHDDGTGHHHHHHYYHKREGGSGDRHFHVHRDKHSKHKHEKSVVAVRGVDGLGGHHAAMVMTRYHGEKHRKRMKHDHAVEL